MSTPRRHLDPRCRGRHRGRPLSRQPRASCFATRCSTQPASSCGAAAGPTSRWRTSPLAAGVSRQTLYKEFGSRDDFAQALVMREADALPRRRRRRRHRQPRRPARALAAAFDVFLRAAAENPLVRTLVRGDGAEELLALFTTHGRPLVESATERLDRRPARRLAAGRARARAAAQRVPGPARHQLRRVAHRPREHDRRLDRHPARALRRAGRRAQRRARQRRRRIARRPRLSPRRMQQPAGICVSLRRCPSRPPLPRAWLRARGGTR